MLTVRSCGDIELLIVSVVLGISPVLRMLLFVLTKSIAGACSSTTAFMYFYLLYLGSSLCMTLVAVVCYHYLLMALLLHHFIIFSSLGYLFILIAFVDVWWQGFLRDSGSFIWHLIAVNTWMSCRLLLLHLFLLFLGAIGRWALLLVQQWLLILLRLHKVVMATILAIFSMMPLWTSFTTFHRLIA